MSMSYADMQALQAMYDTAGALEAKKIANSYKLGKSEISARLKIAAQQSKDTRYGIDAERETALANIEQARQEMLRIGIPEMEIKRFVAESTRDLAESELALKRDLALGYVTSSTALDAAGQQRYATLQQEIAGLTDAARTAGTGSPEATSYRQQIAAKQAELATLLGTTRTPTLEREELDRRFGFDVAQFGAQLASTPDTYFQARRFQGLDVPRLLGGAGAQTAAPTGGPTPGVATMGAYLSGQDPYATPYGGPAAGAPQPAAPGTVGLPGTPEDDRAKQVAKIAAVSPPSPYAGLNEQDTNTLKLMESIYKQGGQAVAGGEYERLAASGRLGYLQSAGRLLGYDPKEFEAQYAAYRPAQGAANLAG